MVFIETPVFTSQIKALPDKIRVSAKGHGKRGGARVIYYYFVSASQIALLWVYPKNEQVDLTPVQKAALKKIIELWS